MNNKVWIKKSFIFTVIIIIIIGIFNYIVDPFHQYRVKTFYPIAYISKLQRYINPGFAKNYDYDSIILGSSISENFVISDVKKILNFQKPIKLCISGTSAYEEGLTLKTALKHKKVKNVLYGLDTFLFWGNPNRIRHGAKTFPYYLYDNKILNDYQYIFSLDTTVHSIKVLYNALIDDKNSIKYNYDKMYQWQHTVPSSHFSKKYVLKKWDERKKSDIAYQPNNNFMFYKKSFDKNFLDLIKVYPNTNFIIYFPPYSILAYKLEQEQKVFQDRLKFKKYIFEATKQMSNVKIYDFQIAKNVTHNLSNYHDLDHYHQKINKWVLEQIKNNNFKVNEKNIDSILKEHEFQVNRYIINQGNK
jgi:hypothetical protein